MRMGFRRSDCMGLLGSRDERWIGGDGSVRRYTPTNATTVRLTVTAKGTKGGTLSFYPAGNPAGASGDTLDYPVGNGLVSTVIKEQHPGA